MKRKKLSRIYGYILHQIYNERRSNWALLAELLIVSSVVWYLVDSSYTMVARAIEPKGFDASNCYRIILNRLDVDAVGYDPEHPDSTDITVADKLALLDRLRHDEDIECAAYSLRNDPYQGSSMSNKVSYDTIYAYAREIFCQPDFLKVFRYRGTNGETPEQLAALLNDNHVLLSKGTFKQKYDMNKMIGKEMFINTFDMLPKRLVAIIDPVKRAETEELHYTSVVVRPLRETMLASDFLDGGSLAVRVKENKVQGFEERFRQKIKGQAMREGNYFISDFASYDRLGERYMERAKTPMRYYVVAIVFLLMNVFLGLLGTFWFRTQHRFPEIGLQKAIGATNTDITLRLFAEAVLLLTIAFIPSLVIDFSIADAELTEYYRGETLETGRFLICAALSYALMLLIIGLGIWFPALRAVKANPVEVLRGE